MGTGCKTVNVSRDTCCEGVVVSGRLVEDSQMTGKCCVIAPIDNTVLLAEKARRIHVKTPYSSGDVEAWCIAEAICDLVVGNVPGETNPDHPDTVDLLSTKFRSSNKRSLSVTDFLIIIHLEGRIYHLP